MNTMKEAKETIHSEIDDHIKVKNIIVKRIKLTTNDMKKLINSETENYNEIENNIRLATTTGESIIAMYDNLKRINNIVELKKTLL